MRLHQRIALQLYSALMGAAQPLLRRKILRRARQEPGYGHALAERYGYYQDQTNPQDQANPHRSGVGDQLAVVVWVHAVSLGETRAAAVLVERLRSAIPGMRLLLTHGTATGRQAGQALLRAGDIQVWQPWDTRAAVQRFLAAFKPAVGLLMETEIWPNLSAACARAGVPLCLVNARLSQKSLHQALRLSWLARPAYAALHAVWAQTDADAQRLRQLGAPVRGVTGNLKFDATPDPAQLAQGRAWRSTSARPVVLFASSREGEEALWLQALKDLAEAGGAGQGNAAQAGAMPDAVAPVTRPRSVPASAPVQWLVVPRHPQRFDEVASLLAAAGWVVSRRSTWEAGPPAAPAAPVAPVAPAIAGEYPPVVWLGDSLGEMPLYYGLADAALLGGSFAPLGGQNLIEAAACACPVIMGTHTFNFAEAARMAAQAGAAQEVADVAQGVRSAVALVQSPATLQAARTAALEWSQAHRGAALRTVDAVLAVLGMEKGLSFSGKPPL